MIPEVKRDKSHIFVFNNKDNGGEQLQLKTVLIHNGDWKDNDPKVGFFTNQTLTLHSYCNSASLNLYGVNITPDLLRELANQLEKEQNDFAAELVVKKALQESEKKSQK